MIHESRIAPASPILLRLLRLGVRVGLVFFFFRQDFLSWPDVLQNTDEEVDASE